MDRMDRASFRKLNAFAQKEVRQKNYRQGICYSGQRCYFHGVEGGVQNIVFLNSFILRCTVGDGFPEGPFSLSFQDSHRDYNVCGRFIEGKPHGDFEIRDVRFLPLQQRAAEESEFEGEGDSRPPVKVSTTYRGGVFFRDERRRMAKKPEPRVKVVQLSFSFIPDGVGEWRRETFKQGYRNSREAGSSKGDVSVSWYCGQFQRNLFHGFGIYRDSKMTYNGNWRNQRPHGSGTFVDHVAGTTSVGGWVDGEFIGEGMMLFPFSGAEIAGVWKAGGVIASGLTDDPQKEVLSRIPLLEQNVNLARLDALCAEREGSLLDEALAVSPCNVWLGYMYARRAVIAAAVEKFGRSPVGLGDDEGVKSGLIREFRVFEAPDSPLAFLTDDFAAFFRTQFLGDLKTFYGADSIEAVAAVARLQVFQFISAMVRVIFLEMVANERAKFMLRSYDLAEFALVFVVADLTLKAVGDCLFGLYENESYSSPEGLRFAFKAKMLLGSSRRRLEDLVPMRLLRQSRMFRRSIGSLEKLHSGLRIRDIIKAFRRCVRRLPSGLEGSTTDDAILYCLLKSGINILAVSSYLSDWVCTKWVENDPVFSLVRKVLDRLVSILNSKWDLDIVWESEGLCGDFVEKLLDHVAKNPRIKVAWLIDLFAVLSLEVSTYKRRGDLFVQKALILKHSDYPQLTPLLSGVGKSLREVNRFLAELSEARPNHTVIRRIAIRTRPTESVPEPHVCVWTGSGKLTADAFDWLAVRIKEFVLSHENEHRA